MPLRERDAAVRAGVSRADAAARRRCVRRFVPLDLFKRSTRGAPDPVRRRAAVRAAVQLAGLGRRDAGAGADSVRGAAARAVRGHPVSARAACARVRGHGSLDK